MAIMVGAVTYAYFSDSGTSSGNVFATGTLDMQLANDNSTWTNSVTASVGQTNMAPGDTFTGDLYVRNNGTVSANHLDLDFTNALTEAGSPPGDGTTPSFASVLEISTFGYDSDGNGSTDVNLRALISDLNANEIIDFADIEAMSGTAYSDLTNLNYAGTQSTGHLIHIDGRLHPSLATNANQGDSDTVTFGIFMDQGPH